MIRSGATLASRATAIQPLYDGHSSARDRFIACGEFLPIVSDSDNFVNVFCIDDGDHIFGEQAPLIRGGVSRFVCPSIPESIGNDDPIALLFEMGNDTVPVLGCGWETMNEQQGLFRPLGGDIVIMVFETALGNDVFVVVIRKHFSKNRISILYD